MSGHAGDRTSRLVPTASLVALAGAVASHMADLKVLHLCDLDLNATSTIEDNKVGVAGRELIS